MCSERGETASLHGVGPQREIGSKMVGASTDCSVFLPGKQSTLATLHSFSMEEAR